MSNQTITAKVRRFDPSKDKEPRYETYQVPRTEGMVIADVLGYIYENYDGSLAYRWECRVRQCGTCTVMLNGKPALACKEHVPDLAVIEPLPILPVIRDLVVDRQPLLDMILEIEGLTRSGPHSARDPEPMTKEQFKKVKIPKECCLCFACIAACPVSKEAPRIGLPAALIRVAKFAFNPYDSADRRKDVLEEGLYDCNKSLKCFEVCPHEIPVPDIIEMLRGMAEAGNLKKVAPTAAASSR